MLDYAHQRVIAALSLPRRAVLATSGPAGLQAGEFPCQAVGLDLYLQVPGTSDHLFNLEQDRRVTLLAPGWELRGEAQVVHPGESRPALGLLQEPEARWCVLVQVRPVQVHLRAERGWGSQETIDLSTS